MAGQVAFGCAGGGRGPTPPPSPVGGRRARPLADPTGASIFPGAPVEGVRVEGALQSRGLSRGAPVRRGPEGAPRRRHPVPRHQVERAQAAARSSGCALGSGAPGLGVDHGAPVPWVRSGGPAGWLPALRSGASTITMLRRLVGRCRPWRLRRLARPSRPGSSSESGWRTSLPRNMIVTFTSWPSFVTVPPGGFRQSRPYRSWAGTSFLDAGAGGLFPLFLGPLSGLGLEPVCSP